MTFLRGTRYAPVIACRGLAAAGDCLTLRLNVTSLTAPTRLVFTHIMPDSREGLPAMNDHDLAQRPDMDDPDFYFSDAEDDPMNEVFCVECGRGDDEHNLLLCDGKPSLSFHF